MTKQSTRKTQEKHEEAIRQWNQAERGDAASQNAIAAKLAQGYFMKKNLSGALYWYGQALKQGYTHAKWNAGTMLLAGEGVATTHMNLGMTLIEQAAECGDVSACLFLSQCYMQGNFGKEKDLQLGERWNSRAQDRAKFVEFGQPVNLEDHGIALSKPQLEWSEGDTRGLG